MAKQSPSMALVKGQQVDQQAEKSDLIMDTVTNIENLDKTTALDMVSGLYESIDYNYFQLGGVLSVIQSHGWYAEEGYDSFRSFVEGEYAIKYRKALYLIEIYVNLAESGVEWDDVKHLGWTKLKELSAVLTPDNVAHWVEVAENSTVLQLIEAVNAAKGGSDPADESDTVSSAVSTMTFKVHTDQKETIRAALDKSKEQADTDVDTVGLEMICLAFLEGGSVTKQVTDLKGVMQAHSWNEVLGMFEQLWPDVDLEVTLK